MMSQRSFSKGIFLMNKITGPLYQIFFESDKAIQLLITIFIGINLSLAAFLLLG